MTDEQSDGIFDKGDSSYVDGERNEKETNQKRTVSFNKDVHIKRFGKSRDLRAGSNEYKPILLKKEPFTNLSAEELIEEANKVRAQADSVTCTADHPPEKFFSLPHRKKLKSDLDKSPNRRNSDDSTIEGKKALGRSTSDVSSKKKSKERTSLSTLFRKAQKNKVSDIPVIVEPKPIAPVKRSKSDVSDLKSNAKLNTQPKPIRKRAGSETEEFLKSLRNKKSQLSPIIESSPREDYFRKTPPLETFQKQQLSQKHSLDSDTLKPVVNPVVKPPRYKSPEKEHPEPPVRSKRSKSKEQSPPIAETPKRKTDLKKTLLVDEIDSIKAKDINPVEIKERIKESIKKIQENIYADKNMIHSSQQPPDKPPLTRGHTVGHIVRILKEDQHSAPPKAHLISPPNSGSNNQPFSYTKPSVSPDPNLYMRTTSPERVPTPVNKMNEKGVVYAQVVRGDNGENGSSHLGKQTVHKTYSPSREKYNNISDEDEGLGYEEKNKFSPKIKYYHPKEKTDDRHTIKITDSPIRPKFREFKLTSFDDFEPTYANDFPSKEEKPYNLIDSASRGRADGMDSKRKNPLEHENINVDFNELSHRRQLLESRVNARKYDRDRINNPTGTISRYLAETDPIYEANKKMKATEKYVNETAKYYRHTLDRNGFTESDDYKFDREDRRVYNSESRKFENDSRDEIDRREFINSLHSDVRKNRRDFPPEPEYEPPSLEFHTLHPTLTPLEYKEKKYKSKNRQFTSSQDVLHTGQKYKRDDWFGKRKGHYASNPEIAHEREDDYVNTKESKQKSYHNSLKRDKSYRKEAIRRHDSADSRDYGHKRYDFDNRLVDSGIENDFRKSSGEIHRRHDDDARNTTLFLANERQHTENNYPSEQVYANGEYITRFEGYRDEEIPRQKFVPRERNADDGSHFDPRIDRFDHSPGRHDDKLSAKPPKAVKKLSGLEKMKQLFSLDSSKKRKKEKEVQGKSRTRVLKSPEHLAPDDSEYRRYKDPEPSDDDRRKGSDSERKPSDLESDIEKYKPSDLGDSERYRRYSTEKRYYSDKYDRRVRRYAGSSEDRESDQHSPGISYMNKSREQSRNSRSVTADSLDSPALAERYRVRRRLATPSPTPSPPRVPSPTPGWFKSLDRLTRKKNKSTKVQDKPSPSEARKAWTKPKTPAKNLRFFGDTDPESDGQKRPLRKTISSSTTGIDDVDHGLSAKSYSLTNLGEDKRSYKRNLHNISENQAVRKPPIDRSRSQSSTKNVRRERGSSSEIRGSKQEINKDLKHRRRTPTNNSGESSTEGESSHQSQRSVVYLHATTVGDIPDPGRMARNRSKDDVSSVNSSQLQVRSTTKSFSIFAPWTPRHYTDNYDVNYAQRPRRSKPREPIKKASSTKNLADDRATLQKNKSYSQTTLTRRPQNHRLTNSSTTLNRKPEINQNMTMSRAKREKSQSTEVLRDRERVSRSISMPKDNNKKAGWFKLSNKTKKQETPRVR